MKVLIDIPEEFEIDYRTDCFGDFFNRAKADMDVMCGTYERETADVLAKAFEESKVYDPDKVVEQLEEKTELAYRRYMDCPSYSPCFERYRTQYAERKMCLEIVKGGGADGN